MQAMLNALEVINCPQLDLIPFILLSLMLTCDRLFFKRRAFLFSV